MAGLVVTLDGPAASGKSTAARLLAERIGADFLDTGAMYRAVTWAALAAGVDPTDTRRVLDLIDRTTFAFVPKAGGMQVSVNGRDVTLQIRDPEVTDQVRHIAAAAPVRARLVDLQRDFAKTCGRIVTEGRDQGTVVFPRAQLKVFLTASLAERARRRRAELQARGVTVSLEEIERTLDARDRSDQDREVGALKAAQDAVVVDTTGLTIDRVVKRLADLVTAAVGPPGRAEASGGHAP